MRLRTLLVCAALASMGVRADETATERLYLTGLGKDDGVAWEFFCTGGQNAGFWTNILVPSCWETKGFGAYGYQHDPVKEQGKYRRTFVVPASWQGRTVKLTFEGAMTDTEVWINGQSAGPVHQGGFYPFSFDVTALVRFGATNLIEATVSKCSANKGVNDAERRGDYWNFGGIFRPVHLEALPPRHIERVALDARADGTFRIDVFPAGAGPADRVNCRIAGLGGSFSAPVSEGAERVRLETRVSGQTNWTAETPSLYSVSIELEAQGRAVHRIEQRFGFRTFEVRAGEGLYLNGQRIVLKGSCRHSFWPDSGRTTSPELSREDVRLMKEMNMNAVRMSHYPPDRHFLDTCDEMGLYVLDELAGWQHAYDTPVGRKRVEAMVKRDVNHPSILFWDNGNEGGFNFDLDSEYGRWDPQQRRVLHPWALHDGVQTAHYRPYDEVKAKCDGDTLYMPTEFLHALYDGGGGAGLDDYWSLLGGRTRMGVGGFIWAFVDEGVVRMDRNGVIDNNGNRAPDGLLGPRREKEGSFHTVREIWCPVQIGTAELPQDFDGKLDVENRFDFTDLASCHFEWRVVEFPGLGEAGTEDHVIAQGTVPGPAISPHQKGRLKLPLPDRWREAHALKLTAKDPAGRHLWTWSWPTRRAEAASQRIVTPEPAELAAEQSAQVLHVRTAGRDLEFDRTTGGLKGVLLDGHRLPFALRPQLLVSGTRRVSEGGKKRTEGVDLTRPGRVDSMSHRMQDNNIQVDAAYAGGDLSQIQWTVRPGGWTTMRYAFSLNATCDLAGIQFDVPESAVKSVRWLGRGPYRVWKNRLKGTELGVWTNSWNDTDPGKTYDYPEFKGFYGSWNWAVLTLDSCRITIVNAVDESYLGVFRPRDGESPMETRLYIPQLGIGIYHAIPAIGNKFAPASVLGPQSQPNVIEGPRGGLVHLRFDPLP